MMKLLKFWLLNRVIKNPTLSAEVYQMMYQNRLFFRPHTTIVEQVSQPISVIPVKPNSSQRRELLSALTELKSKTVKTKQDKESIGMLEAALKNVN